MGRLENKIALITGAAQLSRRGWLVHRGGRHRRLVRCARRPRQTAAGSASGPATSISTSVARISGSAWSIRSSPTTGASTRQNNAGIFEVVDMESTTGPLGHDGRHQPDRRFPRHADRRPPHEAAPEASSTSPRSPASRAHRSAMPTGDQVGGARHDEKAAMEPFHGVRVNSVHPGIIDTEMLQSFGGNIETIEQRRSAVPLKPPRSLRSCCFWPAMRRATAQATSSWSTAPWWPDGRPHGSLPGDRGPERRAKRRLPHFSWYWRHRRRVGDAPQSIGAVDVELVQLMKGVIEPDTATLFDVEHAAPIGVEPLGMSGLIWPGADQALARTAQAKGFPRLSTVATTTPEDVGPLAATWAGFSCTHPRRRPPIGSARPSRRGRLPHARDHRGCAEGQPPRGQRKAPSCPAEDHPMLMWQSVTHPAWSMAVRVTGFRAFAPSSSTSTGHRSPRLPASWARASAVR